jgi:hypothetical protein
LFHYNYANRISFPDPVMFIAITALPTWHT